MACPDGNGKTVLAGITSFGTDHCGILDNPLNAHASIPFNIEWLHNVTGINS